MRYRVGKKRTLFEIADVLPVTQYFYNLRMREGRSVAMKNGDAVLVLQKRLRQVFSDKSRSAYDEDSHVESLK